MSTPMSEYDALLDVLAAHPGASRDELRELVRDDDRGVEVGSVDGLLDDAVAREDVVETNGSYWVMRTGRFAFDEYDHPSTGEWRDG